MFSCTMFLLLSIININKLRNKLKKNLKRKGSEIKKTIGEGSDSILPAQAYQMFWQPENIFWNMILLDLYYQVSSATGMSFTVFLSLYNGNLFSANSPISATIVTSNIKERVITISESITVLNFKPCCYVTLYLPLQRRNNSNHGPYSYEVQ